MSLRKSYISNKLEIYTECRKVCENNYCPLVSSADDASGRFTNGFFWGNSYFIGSATECDYIGQDYSRKNPKIGTESSIEEVREFNAEPRKLINAGLSGNNMWAQTNSVDVPPYRLGFYMMKLSINASRYTTVSTNRYRAIDLLKYYSTFFYFNLFSYLMRMKEIRY